VVNDLKNYIIPIFVPHYGCSHQCIFCNQKKITGQNAPAMPENVSVVINEALNDNGITQKRITKKNIEAAFYGGSFTALGIDEQSRLLKPAYEALMAGKIHAIRLSTRPDAIDENVLRNLAAFKVGTIELGVQSLDDKILKNAVRGHTVQDVFRAVRLIREAGISCGLQLMPGLPGEDWPSLISTASRVCLLAPDFVRIYPAVVIAGTVMAELYGQGIYEPLSLKEAVSKAAYLKLMFGQNGIPVIRTGLQATTELDKEGTIIKGPYHPAFGEMVDAYLFYIMMAHFIEQSFPDNLDNLIVHHHPQDSSKVRGLGLENIKKIKNNYGIRKICLKADGLKRGELIIEHNHKKYNATTELINLI